MKVRSCMATTVIMTCLLLQLVEMSVQLKLQLSLKLSFSQQLRAQVVWRVRDGVGQDAVQNHHHVLQKGVT